MERYDVVKFSEKCKKKTIKRNVSLETAKAYCNSPLTKGEDKICGRWFYGFTKRG